MAFDLTLFTQNVISILPESLVIGSLLIVVILDLIQPNCAWLSTISISGLVIATITLITQWVSPEAHSFFNSYEVNGFTIAFRCVLTLSSTLCILLSKEYVERSGMELAEFLIFVLTGTIGGMFLCGANDLITIFVSLECLSLSSYLLAGYAKRDVRSNEAAMKYLLMGSASSCILAYGFSWLYGLSGGEIQLSHLVIAITNHLNDPLGIWVAFACILVGLGFKISAVPFHQWTPDVYEGVRFVITY